MLGGETTVVGCIVGSVLVETLFRGDHARGVVSSWRSTASLRPASKHCAGINTTETEAVGYRILNIEGSGIVCDKVDAIGLKVW